MSKVKVESQDSWVIDQQQKLLEQLSDDHSSAALEYEKATLLAFSMTVEEVKQNLANLPEPLRNYILNKQY